MTIMQLDPLRVTFSVPNAQARKCILAIPWTCRCRKARSGLGKVEFVSPVTEAESGTVRVKVLVQNSDNKYRCGVRCAIDLDARPAGALKGRSGYATVAALAGDRHCRLFVPCRIASFTIHRSRRHNSTTAVASNRSPAWIPSGTTQRLCWHVQPWSLLPRSSGRIASKLLQREPSTN